MDIARITNLLDAPTEKNLNALLDSQDTVFWVDWREEDDAIVTYCEEILKTGQLMAEVHHIEKSPGFELTITYKQTTVIVPLVIGPADRHITLVTLNQTISADFEIRFCLDSAGSDTLAFLPLPNVIWRELEKKYGSTLDQHFARIHRKPNLFTDGFGTSLKLSWESLARDPSQKAAAIKTYRDEMACGLGEAKIAVESFIANLSK